VADGASLIRPTIGGLLLAIAGNFGIIAAFRFGDRKGDVVWAGVEAQGEGGDRACHFPVAGGLLRLERHAWRSRPDLAQAQAERDSWERRVAGLRANHIDPDSLDERARAMLNLADPADIVVPYAAKDKLF
jgi:hypothetical protein